MGFLAAYLDKMTLGMLYLVDSRGRFGNLGCPVLGPPAPLANDFVAAAVTGRAITGADILLVVDPLKSPKVRAVSRDRVDRDRAQALPSLHLSNSIHSTR